MPADSDLTRRRAAAGEGAIARREGGPADFFLVHGDPLESPRVMWRVWRVDWAD